MKKILLSIALIFAFSSMNNAYSLCVQCPEIQKKIKKEVKFSKEQKKAIKKVEKDMKKQIKVYEKDLKQNQKRIDKILDQDCPDIASMLEIKKDNSKIKADIKLTRKEAYAQVLDIYTEEQREIAKRILSENSTITLKKQCAFCGDDTPRIKKCKDCDKKKKEEKF